MAEKDGIRYRRVSTRMWGDEKFLDLSAPKPNARDLFIWLLTGPCTSLVPGVVLTTLSDISERLDWPMPATLASWDEIVAARMATADWSRQLIWLPNALKHNPPANTNVVKGWRRFFDEEVPECALRWTIETRMRAFLERRGDPFLKAFLPSDGKAFDIDAESLSADQAKGFQEPCRKAFGRQEQEQDQEVPPNPPADAGGRVARVTRAERKKAEDIRRAMSGCPHYPRCPSGEHCIGVLVADFRRNLKAGLSEEPS